MSRPKAQLKKIREDSLSPNNIYWKEAEDLAKAFRRFKRKGRGCRSVDDFVFQLCEVVFFALISDFKYAQFSYHVDHSPKNPEGIDDGGAFLLSFYDCAKCRAVGLYSSLSRNRLADEMKTILNRNKHLIPTTQMRAPRKDSSKPPDVISGRALKRHAKAWLTIAWHPEWLNEGIPVDHQEPFDKWHIDYVNRFRGNLTTQEQAEYVGLLEYMIKANFPNTPLLTP